jgi:NAD(P)-dependent dehydrogenase (short-subunit alcohol dehydrogenase family)
MLKGRCALITGSTQGLGYAMAERLAAEGCNIVMNGFGDKGEIESRRRKLENDHGVRATYHGADVADAAQIADLMATAAGTFGTVDVLINNAGGPPPGTSLPRFGFLELSDEDWRDMLEFNLLSAVRACRAAIPVMLERGDGAIVNVSSVHGRQPSGVNVDYGAAKAAVINLTKALAEEFGPQGIRVNGVCPGPVLTPWWTDQGGAADIFAAHVGADRDGVLTTVAPEMMQLTTGRLADPQEIADAVAYLASPRSASTVGTELLVDSGMLKTS